jgi:hypothetical protein
MSITWRIVMMPRHEARALAIASSWYGQPVLWLGAAVFLASLAGCVWLIVASMRHADIPVETTHTVFGVPDDSHAEGDASR